MKPEFKKKYEDYMQRLKVAGRTSPSRVALVLEAPHLVESLDAWTLIGCPTGGFLEAVLENNLSDAIGRADDRNRAILFEIVRYCHNELDYQSWGSKRNVSEWRARGGHMRYDPHTGEAHKE
jgi:hypothetical protein